MWGTRRRRTTAPPLLAPASPSSRPQPVPDRLRRRDAFAPRLPLPRPQTTRQPPAPAPTPAFPVPFIATAARPGLSPAQGLPLLPAQTRRVLDVFFYFHGDVFLYVLSLLFQTDVVVRARVRRPQGRAAALRAAGAVRRPLPLSARRGAARCPLFSAVHPRACVLAHDGDQVLAVILRELTVDEMLCASLVCRRWRIIGNAPGPRLTSVDRWMVVVVVSSWSFILPFLRSG